MEKLAYNVRETAEVLGLSSSYVYELIRQGIIPAVRLGRRVVVPVEKLKGMFLEPESSREIDVQDNV